MRTGDAVSFSLSSSSAGAATSVHTKETSLQVKRCKGCAMLANLGINQ